MIETEVQEPSTEAEEAVAPPVDVPEAPETVSASDEPAPDTPVSDRPRDANGRFTKRDGTPVAPDEQARLEAAAASVPATPTTSPATQPSSVPAGEPFVFRADGQKIPIPGSTLAADGTLAIPADQVPVIRQLLAEGVAHRGSWRQKEQQYQRQIEEAGAVERAKADKYNAAAMHLFDTVNDPNWLQQLVADPDRTLAYLQKDLGYLLKEAELKAPRPQTVASPQQQEPDEAQITEAFGAALTDEVDELLEDPRLRGTFSADEVKELKDDFLARMAAYAAQIDGAWYVDKQAVKRAFDREVRLAQKAQKAREDAVKAAEFNARRNAPPSTLPPVVNTKTPPAPPVTASTGPTSRDEWRKKMGIG